MSLSIIVLAGVLLLAARAGLGEENLLKNAGFEEGTSAPLPGWEKFGKGYVVDTSTFKSGRRSVRCDCKGEGEATGVHQVITIEKPTRQPIIISGWSKARNVQPGGHYSIYLDIFYEDGTPLWGKQAFFRPGTHDWEYSAAIIPPAKPVKKILVYVMLRRTTGTAWFDDIRLSLGDLVIVPVGVAQDTSQGPNGIRVDADISAHARWHIEIKDPGGTVVASTDGKGKSVEWIWNGEGRPFGRYFVTIAARDPKTSKSDSCTIPVTTTRPRPTEGIAVWTENSMRKIYPTYVPERLPEKPRAAVALARNERESFQVAIASDRPLRGVTVRMSDLRNDGGGVISKDNVKWYQVGFVWVRRPSNHPDAKRRPNWCPDPLLEVKQFDVQPGTTQPIWITVYAPPDAAPGTYKGDVAIHAEGQQTITVPVEVTVYDFALPAETHIKNAFALMDGFLKKVYGGISPALRRQTLDFMLEHRLNPDDISRTKPPAIEDLVYCDKRGLNAFNVVNLVPPPKEGALWVCWSPKRAYTPEFKEQLAARLDGYMAELRKRGLIGNAYFYGWDERPKDYFDIIKDVCGFVKKKYPGVHTFTTARFMPDERWRDDNMDWYCPLLPRYDPAKADEIRKAGEQVWWYVCCGPRYPYPNFASCDYPAIEGRLIWWMTRLWRVDGLLYWHVNFWNYPDNNIIESGPYVKWRMTNIARMTGDGVLTYPGPDGLLSSIRLENIRDGIEDYEYLHLLARSKGEDAVAGICRSLIKDRKDFTRDPAQLLSARRKLAAFLAASK